MSRKLSEPWLDKYLEYVSETEAPDNYRYWCGISALATTLKRSVYVSRGAHLKIYPNHYIILVGPPGVGKGTAMNPAIELIKEANVAHYMEDRISAEKAVENLANGFMAPHAHGGTLNMGKDHCATAVASELSIFLSTSDWMLPLLCTMWDRNEFCYDTKKNGQITIKGLSFGLLGGCTPDYIRRINRDVMAAVAGGFTARSIFSWASKKGKTIAWPDTDVSALRDPLINDLRHIAQTCHGEFAFTPAAKKKFIEFYEDNDAANVDESEFESEVLTNFRARMWSHVVKLAMILSISRSDDLIIELEDLDKAIKEIWDVFKSLDVTFRGVGESDLVEAMDRVMQFIEQKGTCSRSAIMRYNYRHITDEDLTRVLITLTGMGFCIEKTQGRDYVYTYNPAFKQQAAAKQQGAKSGS